MLQVFDTDAAVRSTSSKHLRIYRSYYIYIYIYNYAYFYTTSYSIVLYSIILDNVMLYITYIIYISTTFQPSGFEGLPDLIRRVVSIDLAIRHALP